MMIIFNGVLVREELQCACCTENSTWVFFDRVRTMRSVAQ